MTTGEISAQAQWFSPTSFWRTKTTAEPLAADQSDGNFEIYPVHNTALRLDVTSGSSASGTNVRVYADNNSSGQRWTLIKK